MKNAFNNLFDSFSEGRAKKPRKTGLTIVRDRGLGLRQAEDMVRIGSDYIDMIKLDHGTEVLYDKILLSEKVELYKQHKIETMAGESILEITIWKKILNDYLKTCKELGLTVVGIPSTTIDMKEGIRKDVIEKCLDNGFKVITIAGRKHPDEELSLPFVFKMISEDIKMGIYRVLIRIERFKNGFGICDKDGKIIKKVVLSFLEGVEHPDMLVWEAPSRSQQQDLIYHLGMNVNLDGIDPQQILSLEALRRGLVGEKEKKAYLERKYWSDLQDVWD
jgi:phosphosulfolactate synthase